MRDVKLVVCDLDGTLLDTESLVLEVARAVLARHGAALTPGALAASAGRRPLEAWQATLDALGLTGVTAQQLFDESEALLKERCGAAGLPAPCNAPPATRPQSAGSLQGSGGASPVGSIAARLASAPAVVLLPVPVV